MFFYSVYKKNETLLYKYLFSVSAIVHLVAVAKAHAKMKTGFNI